MFNFRSHIQDIVLHTARLPDKRIAQTYHFIQYHQAKQKQAIYLSIRPLKKKSPHSSPPLPLIPSRIHNQGCRQLSNKFRLQLHSRNTRHRTRIHRRSLLDRNGGRQTRYCDRLGGERDLCLLSASSTLFSTTDNVVRILLEIGVLRWEIRKGGNRDLQCLALR